MTKTEELVTALDRLQEEFGRFTFIQALKIINRRKLLISADQRERRKKFSWQMVTRFYHRQGGICPLCLQPMVLIRGHIEMDHKDPYAVDFNNERNLQLTHRQCNRSKSSLSLSSLAKRVGRPVTELI
jgi:5-methylcytosine-specific restriction endonuclease McrA